MGKGCPGPAYVGQEAGLTEAGALHWLSDSKATTKPGLGCHLRVRALRDNRWVCVQPGFLR